MAFNGAIRSGLRVLSSSESSILKSGSWCFIWRTYASRFVLQEFGGSGDGENELRGGAPISLAKSLACLEDDEALGRNQRRVRTRTELKRLMEFRIKKRVKAQYSDGKFYDLMKGAVAKAETLRDSYDIIRINSNVELGLEREGICFNSMAEQLASGEFDVEENVFMIRAKRGERESLVLPRLKLRVVQEAIRVVLEVVFRPHFSKISHGGRSGRGHRSALNYVCKEIQNSDWCFTLHPNKEVNDDILSKLMLVMEEKVEDRQLLSFIHRLFDASVVNLVFGGFPKGHGLPQEGSLSPILMNIYLDVFDREVFLMSMRYEGFGSVSGTTKDGHCSNLRSWIRRQMKENDVQSDKGEGVRLYACRFMDEIFVSVSGSKDVALKIRLEMVDYLKNSLYLDVDERGDVLEIRDNPQGLQFLGTVIRLIRKESDAIRAVHKLKEKVKLFAFQKREIWESLTVRVGKKLLAHGLKRIKESEIKALNLSTPILDHISQFRKDGMKTDHWYKSLIKIWMQDAKATDEDNEERSLSKYIAEPALPQDLVCSFYNFQKQVENYVSSETTSTLALLPTPHTEPETIVTRLEAPIINITKGLYRYGLVNMRGFPKYVPTLVLQDDSLIINWFSGLARRWLKWYSEFDNFEESKLIMLECVRTSCIRTLASKYQIHESLIEKKFDSDLSQIPTAVEFETEIKSNVIDNDDDEGLMYGISYSGLSMLSLSWVKVPTRVFNCFVMGCTVESPSLYRVHVMERQRFPGWTTGFSTSMHPSLNGRRIVTRGLHSTGVKSSGHSSDPFYMHAKHMYNLDRMKHQKLKMSLFVFSCFSIGVAVPIYAVVFQQHKTASG